MGPSWLRAQLRTKAPAGLCAQPGTLGPSFSTVEGDKDLWFPVPMPRALPPCSHLCSTAIPQHQNQAVKLGPCHVPLCMSLLLPASGWALKEFICPSITFYCGNGLGTLAGHPDLHLLARAGLVLSPVPWRTPPSESREHPSCPCRVCARSSLSWCWPRGQAALFYVESTTSGGGITAGEWGTGGCSPGWGQGPGLFLQGAGSPHSRKGASDRDPCSGKHWQRV